MTPRFYEISSQGGTFSMPFLGFFAITLLIHFFIYIGVKIKQKCKEIPERKPLCGKWTAFAKVGTGTAHSATFYTVGGQGHRNEEAFNCFKVYTYPIFSLVKIF
jgi:hypothetical protein